MRTEGGRRKEGGKERMKEQKDKGRRRGGEIMKRKTIPSYHRSACERLTEHWF